MNSSWAHDAKDEELAGDATLTMARKILYSELASSTMRVRDRSGTAA